MKVDLAPDIVELIAEGAVGSQDPDAMDPDAFQAAMQVIVCWDVYLKQAKTLADKKAFSALRADAIAKLRARLKLPQAPDGPEGD